MRKNIATAAEHMNLSPISNLRGVQLRAVRSVPMAPAGRVRKPATIRGGAANSVNEEGRT